MTDDIVIWLPATKKSFIKNEKFTLLSTILRKNSILTMFLPCYPMCVNISATITPCSDHTRNGCEK